MSAFIDYLLDYMRMAGYAIIILASLRGIAYRRFANILFVGDIVIAIALLATGLGFAVSGISRDITADFIMTPAVVTWAIIHFINMVKSNGFHKGDWNGSKLNKEV
jgi:hypothetical protein